MPFINQAWMAYGVFGGLESGVIAILIGLLVYLLFHWIGVQNRWPTGISIGWSYPVALVLAGEQDLWNMFSLEFAPMQSYQFLQMKLNQIHDADSLYMRILFELLGVAIGIAIGWYYFYLRAQRKPSQVS